MRTYNRICLEDHIIKDGDRRLELKRGKEYITSEEIKGTIVVFSSFWAHGIPVEWFAGAQLFTTA